jgi:hypothetical protein
MKRTTKLKLVDSSHSPAEAGLRLRGERARCDLRIVRAKLTEMMRDLASVCDDNSTFELMSDDYVRILEAMRAAEESIEQTVDPTEEYRLDSEARATVLAGKADAR